jgi:hypothetical protein
MQVRDKREKREIGKVKEKKGMDGVLHIVSWEAARGAHKCENQGGVLLGGVRCGGRGVQF